MSSSDFPFFHRSKHKQPMKIRYHAEALPFVHECIEVAIKDILIESVIQTVPIKEDGWDRDDPIEDRVVTYYEGYVKICYLNSDDQEVDHCLSIAQYLDEKGFGLVYYSASLLTFIYKTKEPTLVLPTREQLKALTLVQT